MGARGPEGHKSQGLVRGVFAVGRRKQAGGRHDLGFSMADLAGGRRKNQKAGNRKAENTRAENRKADMRKLEMGSS